MHSLEESENFSTLLIKRRKIVWERLLTWFKTVDA